MRIAGIVHHHSLGGVIGIPKVLTERLAGSTSRRLKSLPARKSFPPLEPLGGPLSPILGMGGGQSKSLDSMLYGPLRLLRGGSTEDALQPLVHVAHLVIGGCGQRVQKHGHHRHVLFGPGEGGELPLHPLHRRGPTYPKHRFALVQVSQPSLNNCSFIGELASLPCGFSFDVIL
jgi:hypothetical protein